MSDDICPKCEDRGCYSYDHNHSKPCEVCCPHDEGWWLLTEWHSGYRPGKETLACKRGCGVLKHEFEYEAHD